MRKVVDGESDSSSENDDSDDESGSDESGAEGMESEGEESDESMDEKRARVEEMAADIDD